MFLKLDLRDKKKDKKKANLQDPYVYGIGIRQVQCGSQGPKKFNGCNCHCQKYQHNHFPYVLFDWICFVPWLFL